MPERERLTQSPLCDLVGRWNVDWQVMQKAQAAATEFELQTGRDVFIISGFRTAAEQKRLGKAGRPTAPDELSTHRSCIATGIDVDLGFVVSDLMKAIWGSRALEAGLRVGGGSPIDPTTGLNTDWNHVDNGPRTT